ncbi:MAG TPA: FtsX-like permease family protein [Acidimicrobiales bacterium]
MSGRVLPVAWYRFRSTLARQRGGYLAVVVLVGLLGGVAIGAIAGARRTQSAFPAYLAATKATPATLAAGLAAGAVVALGLTLTASVRRRRRDLALLKTLGFTPRQVATAVAWQASVAASIGIIIGVPAGIALGRWLWTLFARAIYAVPQPSVPVLEIVLVGLGALVLANVVAAIPGRIAARTSTAFVLRAE